MSNSNAPTNPTQAAVDGLMIVCHTASAVAGWWEHHGHSMDREVRDRTRLGLALTAEKLCLVHSEISEAMEGVRKDLRDDKLPHHKMITVELADALIRIFDLAGAMDLPLGAAFVEKMAYNAQRADHKPENRAAVGGKAF